MKPSSAVLLIGLGCLGLLTWGCKERTHRVAASYSSVTQPTYPPAPTHAPAPMLVGLDAIPTEEDYEERAAADISEANLASKLTEFEKEMAF